MNKFLKYVVCFCCLTFTSYGEVCAFQSQAHWEIAQQTLNLNSKKLNPEQEKIYKSGAFLADIGRLNWDSKYSCSDSEIFAENLMKNCNSNNIEETLFSLGWRHHVVQDSLGSVVPGIFSSESISYAIGCSKLENYFRHNGSKMLFRGDESFYIDCDLIRLTYKNLHNFSPTDEDIFLELNKLIIGVNLLSILPQSKIDLSKIQKQSFITQINKLSETCANDFKTLNYSNEEKDEHILFNSPEQIAINIEQNGVLYDKLKEFNNIAYLEKIGSYRNFCEVIYRITDQEKYDLLLKESIPLILDYIK